MCIDPLCHVEGLIISGYMYVIKIQLDNSAYIIIEQRLPYGLWHVNGG